MRRFASTAVVFLFLSGAWLSGHPRAYAAASSCNTANSWFYGAVDDPALNLDGGRADIRVRNPALCPVGQDTFSSAWSMLTTKDAAGGWAQIGYDKGTDHGGVLSFFWQSGACAPSCLNTSFFGSPEIGAAYNFRVDRFTGDGKIRLRICDAGSPPSSNCVVYHTTTWDPRDRWNERHTEFFAETAHRATDMPGKDNNRATFTQVDRKTDGDWTNAALTKCLGQAGPTCNDSAYYAYHFAWINQPTSFEVWTDPIDR